MALQNIGASNRDDAFYRYKMPKMITKIEGRGNGIKTNVVNMVDIAKALARPASYTTKYFGCELGAQSKFDEKTGVSLVNGAHDTAKLSDVDMRDKLTTFILKNPPEPKKGSKDKKAMRRAEKERLKEGEAADEEQKKLKKEGKKKGSATTSKDGLLKASTTKKKTSGSDEDHISPRRTQADVKEDHDEDDDDGDDIEWQTDTSLEAARQRIQEQLSSVTADMVMLSTDESEKKQKEAHKPSDIPGADSMPPLKENLKAENGVLNHQKLVEEIKGNWIRGLLGTNFGQFWTHFRGLIRR
ncbi:hypothetical protein NMG60_11006135 [Bertholletia excelsa]